MTIVFVTHSVFESAYLSSRIAIMTPRPGRIIVELPLDAPRKRDGQFRTSAEYAAVCRRVSQALVAASAEADKP
jgi:NitT/TauT family transport system ATP-binding protein